MKAGMTSIIVGILVLLVLCPIASADWTEQVPLTEVNTNYHDKSPFLSFDGLTLYFCRENGPWGWTIRIYQATRTEPAGPFTSVEEISTLNISNAHVAYPWVSQDNLRMYYYRSGGGRARLMVTTRASTNDPYLPGVEISELSALGNVYTPSLTTDELTIVFSGDSLSGGQGGLDVWIATRPNITSPFSNVRNLAEINSSAADGHSSISPDGLTLHFVSDRNSSGIGQLFKATRESLDAPFGSPEHLSFFDSPGSSLGYPFLSSDGKAFYFAKSVDGQPLDIYVSYSHIPEPNQWSQPVPLTEVNTQYEEWAPFLSFDKLSLYFSRVRTDIPYYGRIYQAIRNTPSGPFTSIIEISELNETNAYVLCPWVSPDNLRMYYFEQTGVGWRLKFSERPSINNTWPQGEDISELNQLALLVYYPRLTADELIIFFNVREDIEGNEQHDIWMATRPNKNSPFSQIRKLNEINTASQETHAFPSPDGLTLYFASDRNGNFQLFKATRESLDAPFGPAEHLSFFDTPGGLSLFPCIAGDASAFYFVREPAGRSSRNIWVSYSSEIPPPPPKTYYVDGVNGSDDNNGLTPETAFATIQKGISSAKDGDKVLVFPAVYTEQIAYEGKAITVQGIATKAGIPILQVPEDFAVLFQSAEGADSVFKNFIVKNSFMAIFIAGSSPTIKNLTIVDNKYGIAAFVGSEPDISNCIFWRNTDSDLQECTARYSRTSNPGEGNIDADPCFVDVNNADYHLLSQRGRYWPAHDVWVLDKVTSPCVDGGDPYDNPSGEPMPNGGRIDIGAFGGTPFASLSDWPIASDANHDGKVDLADLSILCEEWLSILPWAE
jgi:Tol biopolymer transport system component